MPCAVFPLVLLPEAHLHVRVKDSGFLPFCPMFYNDLLNALLLVVPENTADLFPIMETAPLKLKSLLKKPGKSKENSKRRVTFCSTVKFYTDGSAPITAVLGSSSRHLSEVERVDSMLKKLNLEADLNVASEYPDLSDARNTTLSRWFELDDNSPETLFNTQADEVEDFFVHKVIYDSHLLLDDNDNIHCVHSENEDVGCEGYNFPDDDECENFVVHQVIQDGSGELQDSDGDASGKEDGDGDTDTVKAKMLEDDSFCTLSKKNIMHHNKLIEENILNHSLQSILNFSPDTCISVSNEPKLSPPLKELGIEKLTSEQPNSLLLRLDISPLNSVQESDSETNSSSEDTMIMMTSEECQKNEEHIRESFLQYQFLKQNKIVSLNQNCSITNSTNNSTCCSVSDSKADELSVTDIGKISEPCTNVIVETSDDDLESSEEIMESVAVDCPAQENEPCELSIKNNSSEFQVVNAGTTDACNEENQETVADPEFCGNRQDHVPSIDVKPPMPSLSSFSSGNNWSSSLASVVIPPDVRQWKITVNSDSACVLNQRTPTSSFSDSDEISSSTSTDMCVMDNRDKLSTRSGNNHSETDPELHNESPLICNSDELENFVYQSSERLDRIRKRYSLSEKTKFTLGEKTVRGIRPRFRSTAEILRQMQTPIHNGFSRFRSSINPIPWPQFRVNQPKSIFLPDRRWSSPYLSSIANEVSGCFMAGSSQHFSRSCEHTVDYSLYTMYASGKTSSHNTFFHESGKASSSSSCAFSVLAERGIPEGASSETICEPVLPPHPPSTGEEGIVYFSMKV